MASRGVNKVILIGNLGQDPELRYLPNGGAVINVSLATSEAWKDKETGQPQDRTEWHNIVFFNRLAEIVGEYCRKGSKLYVEGSLRTRKWQDQGGNDRYTTEIAANEMQILDGGRDNAATDQSQNNQQRNNQAQRQQQPSQNGRQQNQQRPAPQRQQSGGQQQSQNRGNQQNRGANNQRGQQNNVGNFDDFNPEIPFS